jgi:hypothetical protein
MIQHIRVTILNPNHEATLKKMQEIQVEQISLPLAG